MSSKNEINMLQGPITGNLLRIALPMAAFSILQQLFNAADVAVVGRFASSNAIAAVGASTPIINMFITFFGGLSTGGNIAISNYIGSGDNVKVNKAVRSVFTLSLICAALVVIFGEFLARPILTLLNTPDEILDKAVLYLRLYFVAMIFAVIYNFGASILRSKGDTKRPLYCLIASGIINVLLNLLLVIVFKMDVAGVGIATLIANIICCTATVIILLREKDSFKISFKTLCLDKQSIAFTLRIGLPAGIQGMLFSISNMFIQTAINSFGPNCISGNTAAMNFEYMAYFFINSFGQASATYMSQNFGAKQYDRFKKVFKLSVIIGSVITLAVCCLFYFAKGFWIGLFTKDPNVQYYAFIRMLVVVLPQPLTSLNEMSASALRSMGISLPPTIVSITGSCLFRIIWINTLFRFFPSIWMIMVVYPISWILLGIAMYILYANKRKKCFPN